MKDIARITARVLLWIWGSAAVSLVAHEFGHGLGSIASGYFWKGMVLGPWAFSGKSYSFVPQGESTLLVHAGGTLMTLVVGLLSYVAARWKPNAASLSFLLTSLGVLGIFLTVLGPRVTDVRKTLLGDLDLSLGMAQFVCLVIGVPLTILAGRAYLSWLQGELSRSLNAAFLVGLLPVVLFTVTAWVGHWALWAVVLGGAVIVDRWKSCVPIVVGSTAFMLASVTFPLTPLTNETVDEYLGDEPTWTQRVTATHYLNEQGKWSGEELGPAERKAMVRKMYALISQAHAQKPTAQTRKLLGEAAFGLAFISEDAEARRKLLLEARELLRDREGVGHLHRILDRELGQ